MTDQELNEAGEKALKSQASNPSEDKSPSEGDEPSPEMVELFEWADRKLRESREDFLDARTKAGYAEMRVAYTQSRHNELDWQLRLLIGKCKQLSERIETLEADIDGAMFYRGVFTNSEEYELNDVVTHSGSLWICRSDVAGSLGKPGTQLVTDHWKLINKSR